MLKYTLKQLSYFCLVAKYGSLAKAARELNISQPSISKAIGLLEQQLETPLFIRHHAQGVSLTTFGQKFYQRASVLLQQANEFQDYFQHRVHNMPLRVGCYATFAPRIIPKLVGAYKQKYPDKKITIVEGEQETLMTYLLKGDLDIIFVYNFDLPDSVYARKILDLQPKAIVAQNHPLAKYDSVSLRELSAYPFILLNMKVSKNYFINLFTQNNLTLDVAHSVSSIEMVRGLVGHNQGISLLSTDIGNNMNYDGKQVVSIPLKETVSPSSIYIVNAIGPSMHESGRNFIDFCCANENLFK